MPIVFARRISTYIEVEFELVKGLSGVLVVVALGGSRWGEEVKEGWLLLVLDHCTCLVAACKQRLLVSKSIYICTCPSSSASS